MADTAVTTINQNMLEREVTTDFASEPTLLNNIHRVYIYNPNYQKGETMDPNKQGKFKIKVAVTWEEVFIDPFIFWLIDVVKCTSGEVVYKDEYWDAILTAEWKPARDYYYTNEYPVICKDYTVVWFRKMKTNSDILYFKKRDLSKLLRLPKVNWMPNNFSEVKTKQDWGTYRTSVISEWHVIYWVFLDWPYKDEYFMFYPKDNLIWYNYSKWAYIQPAEWTLTRIMEDKLVEWNKIRAANGMKDLKNLPYSLVDLKLSTTVKDVMWKQFNVGKLDFENFTAVRWDNIDDVNYISEFRKEYFEERFGGFKEPLKVVYLDKFGKNYDEFPSITSWITITDCRFEYDFNYKPEVKAIESSNGTTIEDAQEIFDIEPEVKVDRNWQTLKGGVVVPFN